MTLSREELERLRQVRERHAPRWAAIAYLIFIVAGLVHALRSRAIEDLLVQSRQVAIAFSVVALLIVIVVLFADLPRLKLSEAIRWIIPGIMVLIAIALGAAVAGTIFYSVGVSVHDLYLWVRNDLSEAPQTSRLRWAILVALPLVAGVVLFSFRLMFRSLYGLSEAAVGLWVGGQDVSQNPITPAPLDLILPILTASVYLIVRGFDNVHQGLTSKDRKDPVATKTIEWLRMPWKP